MKKLALMFAAVVAISFASCGNATDNAAANDSDSIDSNAVQTECPAETTPAEVDTTANA